MVLVHLGLADESIAVEVMGGEFLFLALVRGVELRAPARPGGGAAVPRALRLDRYTDSRYVQQGIGEWMPNWVRRNWRTAGGEPVKNQDLWQRLHAAAQRHEIDWRWVKGHNGDPDNERVDVLARDEAVRQRAAALVR